MPRYRADEVGLSKLLVQLRDRQTMARKDYNVRSRVGFSAPYALWVHEKVDMLWKGRPRRSGIGVYWGPAGEAKFLTRAAKEYRSVMALIVRTALKAKKTMRQAQLLAGLFLQARAQERVPVEYGELKASAFTVIER